MRTCLQLPTGLQFPCWFTLRYHVRNWSMYSSVLIKNQISKQTKLTNQTNVKKQTINPTLSSGHSGWTGIIQSAFSTRWDFLCSRGLKMLGNTLKIYKSHCHIFNFHCSDSLSHIWALTCWQKVPVFVAKGTLSAREVRALCLSDPISADFLAMEEFLSETMMCCLHPLCLCALMNAVCFLPLTERKL